MNTIAFTFDTNVKTGHKMTIDMKREHDTLINLTEENDAIASFVRAVRELVEAGKGHAGQRLLRFEESKDKGQVIIMSKTNIYVQFEVWTAGRMRNEGVYTGIQVKNNNTKLELFETCMCIDLAKTLLEDTRQFVLDEEAGGGAVMNQAGYTFPVEEWKALKKAISEYR